LFGKIRNCLEDFRIGVVEFDWKILEDKGARPCRNHAFRGHGNAAGLAFSRTVQKKRQVLAMVPPISARTTPMTSRYQTAAFVRGVWVQEARQDHESEARSRDQTLR
jgi:hypothetical protein